MAVAVQLKAVAVQLNAVRLGLQQFLQMLRRGLVQELGMQRTAAGLLVPTWRSNAAASCTPSSPAPTHSRCMAWTFCCRGAAWARLRLRLQERPRLTWLRKLL